MPYLAGMESIYYPWVCLAPSRRPAGQAVVRSQSNNLIPPISAEALTLEGHEPQPAASEYICDGWISGDPLWLCGKSEGLRQQAAGTSLIDVSPKLDGLLLLGS